jgi:flagellar basal-body rod modification protein FlgD
VTTVNAVSSTTSTSTSSSSSTSSTNTLSYNDFLSLLTTELENQDPTSPMSATDECTQLAEINSVAQQIQTNTTLASLLTTSALTQSELAVGQTVESTDKSTSGTVESVTVDSSGAATATLTNGDTITYSNGAIIQ